MFKKLLSFMLVVVLLFSVITPVSANATEIQSDLEIINIEYPEFDINNYQQYEELLTQYNIDGSKILDIYEFNKSNNNLQKDIPGGVLILSGEFITPTHWEMTLTNIGVHVANNVEVDAKMISYLSGIIAKSIKNWPWLGPAQSITEKYYSLGMIPIDMANVTITGVLSTGEYFTMGGTQYR